MRYLNWLIPVKNHLFCHQVNKLPSIIENPKLIGNQIRIWLINMDTYFSILPVLRNILSSEERKRADRFYKENDTARFIVRRAVLRLLMADELALLPDQIEFITGINGKPHLVNSKGIHFNSSHSGNFAVIVIANQQVGTDIEYINDDFDYISVAEYAFSPRESAALQCSLKPVRDFFTIWTRKEAFLKAIGTGIGQNINLLNCLDGAQPVPSVLTPEKTDWECHTLEVAQDYLLSITSKRSAVPFNFIFEIFDKELIPSD